ncbi:uncharacterized protein LOC122499933 isoform X2 [Leptopilina heterotoma]|uniref:uncharacterized protein LOC122499933 isoform X2 n=1 Tax=Leptopilina heterotoma TaxID=63436 RepID=UPI001CA837CA|nr:uncharacterized protein LOC122499933 isoform X2 [Leptopilina heterotoma]
MVKFFFEMARSCIVRDHHRCVEARKDNNNSSMNVLENREPTVIKCDDAIIIERLVCNYETMMTTTTTTTMEDIMNRDQRTTMHRVYDRCPTTVDTDKVLELTVGVQGGKTTTMATRCRPDITRVNFHQVPNNKNFHNNHNTRTWNNDLRRYSKISNSCDDSFLVTRSRYNRRITSTRFNSTVFPLLRLASLLFAFLVISVNGAPMSLGEKRMTSQEKWRSPCGEAGQASVDYEGDQDVEQISDKQLMVQISMQARTALLHAELFLGTYVKLTFNSDLETMQSEWKKSRYDWLPSFNEIPKHFKEVMEQKYLDQFDVRLLDTILLNIYEYMQKFAVGLEQIVWDQEYYNGRFQEEFKQTELNLGAVLCMLQTALVERAVTFKQDVSPTIMNHEYRNMKAETYRNLRDFLIFRDYVNGLEFILQVFDHLQSKLTS